MAPVLNGNRVLTMRLPHGDHSRLSPSLTSRPPFLAYAKAEERIKQNEYYVKLDLIPL